MKIICFDVEATDKGEVLELCIMDFASKDIIFHSYFKPSREVEWPKSQQVHHISPEMVKNAPSIASERNIIQNIINEADAYMGFAIINDLKYLRRGGIKINKEKPLIEVQELFWLIKGKSLDVDITKIPSLSSCLNLLEIAPSEFLEAHSAKNDTIMTVKIMDFLLNYAGIKELTTENTLVFKADFEREYDYNRSIFLKSNAPGFLSLIQTPGGYFLKNEKNKSEDASYSIFVNSRFLGEYELRKFFSKRQIRDNLIYKLRESDIEFFLNYSNDFDEVRERYYQSIYGKKKYVKLF